MPTDSDEMECRLELKKGSSAEKKVFTKETQRSSLPAKFRDDKRGLSYSDFHREITKKVEDVCPKRLENRLKSRIGRTASGERDLVKYKSYVPSYVKKPEARDVKAGAKQIDSKHTRRLLSRCRATSRRWSYGYH
ncbi:BnaC04g54500D [Brassica napus]|uniref:BnaC04g54500D protein n=1 Tax=Brassica napus TaxID=3708 RepID=A0A078IQI6_BRANA|nr:BnaC04g54500D [Brassica napus]